MMKQHFGELFKQIKQKTDQLEERLKAERAETTKQLKQLGEDWKEKLGRQF